MALRKGEQTREAILWAAIDRFGRDGYRSTSVADVARDAAVSGTLAYAYFPNKEALFFAAVDEDAAAVITEGLSSVLEDPHAGPDDWRQALLGTLVGAVRISEADARAVGRILDAAVLDAKLVESQGPLLELPPVRASEGNVVETDVELAELGGRRRRTVLVQPDQRAVAEQVHGVVH